MEERSGVCMGGRGEERGRDGGMMMMMMMMVMMMIREEQGA